MQLYYIDTTTIYNMCNYYSNYSSYSKGSYYTTILSSIANTLLFVLANKDLVSILALLALEVQRLLTTKLLALEEVLHQSTYSIETRIFIAHCTYVLSTSQVIRLARSNLQDNSKARCWAFVFGQELDKGQVYQLCNIAILAKEHKIVSKEHIYLGLEVL